MKTLMILLIIAIWAALANAQIAVIAHKSVPVDEISRSTLLDYYTGDVRLWENGKPVKVLDLKPRGIIKNTFYKFLGKSSSRMKSIWMKRMLSGEGDPPEAMDSEEAVLKKVATTPGALGFISIDKVTEDVKKLIVIEIEDK